MNDPTQRPFSNNVTMEEKAAILKNDQRTTFHSFAISQANEVGGRFAAVEKAEVVGASPTPPDLPAPDWANDPSGQEPPTGYRIDEVEPVGTFAEIQKSLAGASDAPVAPSPTAGGAKAPTTEDVVEAPRPSKTKLKLKWRE